MRKKRSGKLKLHHGLAFAALLIGCAWGLHFLLSLYYPANWVWINDPIHLRDVRTRGTMAQLVSMVLSLPLAILLFGLIFKIGPGKPEPEARPGSGPEEALEAANSVGCGGMVLILALAGLLMPPADWLLLKLMHVDLASLGQGVAFVWLGLVVLLFWLRAAWVHWGKSWKT